MGCVCNSCYLLDYLSKSRYLITFLHEQETCRIWSKFRPHKCYFWSVPCKMPQNLVKSQTVAHVIFNLLALRSFKTDWKILTLQRDVWKKVLAVVSRDISSIVGNRVVCIFFLSIFRENTKLPFCPCENWAKKCWL